MRGPVLALDDPDSGARELVVEECRTVLAGGGADAIVLGCAGMAAFCRSVSKRLGRQSSRGQCGDRPGRVPRSTRVRTGKRGEFAEPPCKPVHGLSPDLHAALRRPSHQLKGCSRIAVSSPSSNTLCEMYGVLPLLGPKREAEFQTRSLYL